MNGRVAAVLGVGPGLGTALARRFAREGFAVALMARSEESAFGTVHQELGDPEVIVYNAGAFQMGAYSR